MSDEEICKAIVLEVVRAVWEYLPPDGTTAHDFATRVIGAIDNDDVNPTIARLMGEAKA